MTSGVPMSRLVQGDVGSGKTLVAAACIWFAHENDCQSAFMAPTEILTEQHEHTLRTLLEPFGIRVGRLTGAMTARQKREIKEALAGGLLDVVVGTHALISDSVTFFRLGLVITDEQHRFGVEQRAALVRKGEQPHTLVMSATPIPRTLALLVYGDLDVSIIDELPPGRQPVQTVCVDERYRARLNAFIDKLIGEGRQVFVVCPKVEETDDVPSDLKSAEEHAQALQRTFPQHRVACIHGRMKARDKDACMAAFAAGETDILVSTTVIEVGVDVPNAALMIIENAERFGLAAAPAAWAHRARAVSVVLRARVGRAHGGSGARLKVLCDTADGFQIAEADLRQRGPGDFFGNRQHGLPALHIADLGTNMTAVNDARDAARAVLAADPTLSAPEHAALRAQCARLFAANDGHFN
ncbi:MAG: ATP-dependent DNA helicase RecG [Oscillospiraceae bacterium]